ncbi:MAG: 3-oxoacyl-ACP reductase FabG [Halanaerobiales bacterium]|nr:3-oxoacyl-ACP reductase FabG [Halanaerobiales bacterium]
MRLKNKVAIITGAGNGLGKAGALKFAKEGAVVIVVDYDQESGETVKEEIVQMDCKADFYKVDVSNWEQVKTMVENVKEKYGTIDILVNNAGVTADSFLVKMTDKQWDKVIDVNLKGVFNCTKAVAPIMIEKKEGKIINTSSVVGEQGNVGQTNYSATKAGVIGMTKTWAKELGYKGINVNAVAPGYIMTEMVSKVPEKVLEKIRNKVPFKKLGEPEDIANAYLFLASSESEYCNGTILDVNGGISI